MEIVEEGSNLALIKAALEPEIIEARGVGSVAKREDRNLRKEFAQEILARGCDPKFFAGLFVDALMCEDAKELQMFRTKVDIAEKAMRRLDFDLTPKDESLQKLIDSMLEKYNQTKRDF